MQIFIDSAEIAEIKKYLSWGLCDGVTTNPTICLKCGVTDIKERIKQIADLIHPRTVSIEVTSDESNEILKQAKNYASLAENIAIKVTITDRNGISLLSTIRTLVSEGIRVNVTAITTFNQAILAAKAIKSGLDENSTKTPHFISIFAGRISEEQGAEQASKVLKNVRDWLDFYDFKGIEIIVGSVRNPENVELWGKKGAHILTIPPEVIAKSMLGARTKETVVQFINDAEESMKKLEEHGR